MKLGGVLSLLQFLALGHLFRTSFSANPRRRLQRTDAELLQLVLDVLDPNCTEPTPTSVEDDGTVESPAASSDTILRMTDETIKYIELPSDTIFVESIAYNRNYDPNTAFVVVQRPYIAEQRSIQSFVYAIRSNMTTAERIMGPLADATNSTQDLSIWGTALTDTGELVMSVYNQNAIMVFDLKNPTNNHAIQKFANVAAPNDIALDSSGTNIYVAGGTFENITNPIDTLVSNPARGQLMRLDRQTGERELLASDLNTLVGIEVVNDDVWLSKLFAMDKVNLATGERSVEWVGDDSIGSVWLRDNLEVFGDALILSAIAGGPLAKSQSSLFLEPVCFGSAAILAANIESASLEGEPLVQALLDPEVSVAFSQTFFDPQEAPEPVRMVLLEPDGSESYHVEIDLVETRANNPPFDVFDPFTGELSGQRSFFNAEITHASHIRPSDGPGYIAIVNFEVPRIMMVEDVAISDFVRDVNPESSLFRNDQVVSKCIR